METPIVVIAILVMLIMASAGVIVWYDRIVGSAYLYVLAVYCVLAVLFGLEGSISGVGPFVLIFLLAPPAVLGLFIGSLTVLSHNSKTRSLPESGD